MLKTDKYGIIGQIQLDGSIEGGDSACWMGHYVYLTGSKFKYVETFEVGHGGYVRHPDHTLTNNGFGAYYKNPWNGCISRDQLTGVIAGVLGRKDKKALVRMLIHHAHSLFLFSYNTIKNGENPKTAKYKLPDLTLFDIWALYLRSYASMSNVLVKALAFPILCVLDLHMLINTLFVNRQDDPDQINYAIKLIISLEHIKTPISHLTMKILNVKRLIHNIKQYWCTWRQNCDMAKLYELKLNILGGKSANS